MNRTRLVLFGSSALIVVCVSLYGLLVYTLYGTLRMPHSEDTQVKKGEIKSSTLRTQEKLEALFYSADSVASIFTTIDEIAAKTGTTISVVSVSNPAPAIKMKDAPVSSIDVKLMLKGAWAQTSGALYALEHLPVVSRLVDAAVTESKEDAQQPIVDATVRFFIRN
jgi:hypothetical protein